MESDFYRTALIRNFLAKTIKDIDVTLQEATEDDKYRVCSLSKDELDSLLNETVENIVGEDLEATRRGLIIEKIILWCQSK
ncbi:hypothetical protein GWK48_06670 [Metallosphaera tengchongensis]|uniref:Uncharacterized protein n=1 Tax=Metallosphaera tengchongensis TaxID=1532350 RepID=A0A6N0NXI5_9CREN|nr:hypothetical protein [Metallosphaera tengchongensis]QKR00098.1 hypothetical protein GWK48_06670 [Metallosphaera tengchongensis]